jgi:hypothetical protein
MTIAADDVVDQTLLAACSRKAPLPPRKRTGEPRLRKPAESNHHVVCRENLARRSIEQHAHIPYTHGLMRKSCKAFMTV